MICPDHAYLNTLFHILQSMNEILLTRDQANQENISPNYIDWKVALSEGGKLIDNTNGISLQQELQQS
jgi:hypothetical protein